MIHNSVKKLRKSLIYADLIEKNGNQLIFIASFYGSDHAEASQTFEKWYPSATRLQVVKKSKNTMKTTKNKTHVKTEKKLVKGVW